MHIVAFAYIRLNICCADPWPHVRNAIPDLVGDRKFCQAALPRSAIPDLVGDRKFCQAALPRSAILKYYSQAHKGSRFEITVGELVPEKTGAFTWPFTWHVLWHCFSGVGSDIYFGL